MGTTTTKLGLYKPSVGEDSWGAAVNANSDTLDVIPGMDNWLIHGYLGWTMDVMLAQGSGSNAAAAIYLDKLMVPTNITITNMIVGVTQAGTNYTNAQMGVYSSSGTFLAATAVQASGGTNGFGSTGARSIALTSPLSVTGGAGVFVWLASHMGTNGATQVGFATHNPGALSTAINNAGLTASTARHGTYTGHATNPLATIGNLTPSSIALANQPNWMAVS